MAMTFGADPEVFLTRDNAIVPCVGIFQGTKEDPYKVPRSKAGLMIQEDGVTLEFNINPVPTEGFEKAIHTATTELMRYVVRADPSYAFRNVASNAFSAADLNSRQANTIGCDPDNNAWKRGAPRKPISIKELGNDRFAGGHIHFGYDIDNCEIPSWALIQFIEVCGYLPYLHTDKQGPRRKFYGQPGLFREKAYGVEYRTPSNFWLHDPSLTFKMRFFAEQVIQHQDVARSLWPLIDAASDDIQNAISTEVLSDKVRLLSNHIQSELSHAGDHDGSF